MPEMLPWWSALIAAAVGLLIGYLIPRGGKAGSSDQVETLQQELEDYRGQVQQHFQQTASLVQRMTADYKAVYDHLAAGADNLCPDGLAPQDRLDWPRPYVQLPHQPGARQSPDPASYPPDYTTAR